MRILCFILGLFFTVQASAFSPTDMRALGKKAPVQLYLFTSLTCSHCAEFHKKFLPLLKKEYADTGKAQIIIVDMVSGKNGLLATQVIRCLKEKEANRLEDVLYANQSKWIRQEESDLRRMLASHVVNQGLTQEQFDMCISDSELQRAIIEQQANLARLYNVSATPTLIMREGSEVNKWEGSDKKVLKELKEAFKK